MKRADWHTHTHRSNLMCKDSTNFESDLIDRALDIGLGGIGITDHGNLSAHITCIKHLKGLKAKVNKEIEKDPFNVLLLDKKDKLDNFKLGLGTEIYLVDYDKVQKAREGYESIKFHHLVVVAKNRNGYQGLRELSTNGWENWFKYKGMDRVPVYWNWFTKWANKYKGDVVVTTACLGSEFAYLCMEFIKNQTEENKEAITKFVLKMKNLFEDDFYIEIQPSNFEEQIAYNHLAMQVANAFGVKVLVNTDAHYLSKDMKEIHSIYLKSQNAERETEQFYASAYLMDVEELRSYFPYINDAHFNAYMDNSMEVADKVELYDLYRETEVPNTTIGYDYGRSSILAPHILLNPERVKKYGYIINYGTSEHIIDRTLLQQIEMGLIEKNIRITDEVLDRLNRELESLWEISEHLHQRLSNYYLLTKEIVEIMWLVSLVGVSRGSAGAFYICYLLGITQINPIEYGLPEWRHISSERPELPDIDLDTEKGQRGNILEKVKEKYGHRNVLNISTFKTEGTSSAIQTMCRGMGISTEEASYISSLAVDGMTVKKCLDEFETNRDCASLIKEMMNYEGLIENVIAIEGLICGRSVHASGVYIFNEEYDVVNAMMKAPNGQPITQYDMADSDYQGGLKLDFLTIEGLDRIRKDLELLLEDSVIKWQGNLKATYDKYIHPDVLDLEDEQMWEMLRKGDILDAFQYDSVQGRNAISIIEPTSFQQAMDGNALMRLSCDGEQPINRYRRFKDNILLWYEEMKEAGLTFEEIAVMREHLDKSFGVAPTQESVMRLSMDHRIAGFDLVWANKLRKAIAKSKAKDMIQEVYNKFIEKGIDLENRELFLNYVWDSCIVPQLGYAFSEPHLAGYTLILMQEMNLAKLSPLHWKVACLCVNSGDINEDVSSATDYGAIAKAIAGMEKGFVVPPDINSSSLGFKPDMKLNKALYGLSAINGVSNELAKEIIGLRPFASIQDFIDRCVETKIVQPSKMYNLIKAGCFDGLCDNRIQVMVGFVEYLVPEKEKLTTANVPKLFEFGLIPQQFINNYALYLFRKSVFTKDNCSYMINKTQGVYKVGDLIEYYNISLNPFTSAIEYDDDGNLCLSSKEFDKEYKRVQKSFDDWIKSEDALARFNYCQRNELWLKYCTGTLSKWEMDSICYYTKTHELEEMGIEKYYSLSRFSALPKEPESYIEKVRTRYNTQKEYKRMKIYCIAGVVVEKNKAKSMITISTIDGVVDIKLSKETFAHYDRKTPEEASWFTRGTKLMLVGYRRGETFVPRVYNTSMYSSSIMKLELKGEELKLIDKRNFEGEEDYMSYL